MLSDLSPSMSPGWQSVDLAVRALKVALRSEDFQKSPAVVAVVQSVSSTLAELVSHYTTGTAGASKAPKAEKPSEIAQGEPPSSDADAMPSMSEGSEPE